MCVLKEVVWIECWVHNASLLDPRIIIVLLRLVTSIFDTHLFLTTLIRFLLGLGALLLLLKYLLLILILVVLDHVAEEGGGLMSSEQVALRDLSLLSLTTIILPLMNQPHILWLCNLLGSTV